MSELTPEQAAEVRLRGTICGCGHSATGMHGWSGCGARGCRCRKDREAAQATMLAALLDQARAEGAAAVVADVEAVIPKMDPTLRERAIFARIRRTLARYGTSEAIEGPSEARGGAGGVAES